MLRPFREDANNAFTCENQNVFHSNAMMARICVDPDSIIHSRSDVNVQLSMFLEAMFFVRMPLKNLLLKSTNPQTFATQNYIVLISPSHLEIGRSEILKSSQAQ